ncbi:MAG TPA: hypothetical protein VGV85_03980 [Longimicrobiaceae bacterium]|nr:hypothetical protein [Longimicrobiaceae bacterium]
MPNLDSYTDPDDALNLSIRARLSATRPGGTVSTFHLGGHNNITGARLAPGQQYPFTALGRIGLSVPTTREGRLINQLRNRFNTDTSAKSSAQLVLLDTADQNEIHRALKRDAKQTARDDPYADPDVAWLMANRQTARAHLNKTAFSQTAYAHLAGLRGRNQPLFNQMFSWLHHGKQEPSPRVEHHEARGAARLSGHYTNLKDGLTGHAQTHTEARGEYAASKILVTVFSEKYQMKMGKAAAGRQNGIDQIWVKRDPLTGDVEEYLIVESKGSHNATLNHVRDGEQMSPRWVFVRLLKMANGNGSYMELGTNQDRMAEKILRAMFDDARTIKVRGLVFHSLYGTLNEHSVVKLTDLGSYNQPEVVTPARNAAPVFGPAVGNGMSLDTL